MRQLFERYAKQNIHNMTINMFELFKSILPMFLIASCFAIGIEFLKYKIDKKIKQKYGESSEERIDRLSKSLKEAANLSSEIENEIIRRNEIVDKLKGDLDRYQELTKLKETEVEAVVQTMRGELRRESNKSLWQSAGLNLIFFLAGVAVTVYVS